MYFITKKSSETGKKFAQFDALARIAVDAQMKIATKYKIKEWRGAGSGAVFGGISAVIFNKTVEIDTTVWRNVNGSKNEWMPRRTNKAGNAIDAEFKKLPKVMAYELNLCIGFKEGWPFKTIGFAMSNPKVYGFIVGNDWKVKIPKDCTEVTFTEYEKTFPAKK